MTKKKRSRRIKRVQSLAQTEERSHCRAMGEAQRALVERERQLAELKAYRQDYARGRNPGQPGSTISSARYADYQNFLRRLDDAVHAQAEAVRSTQLDRDAHRERWLVKRRKMESLQRVAERCQADETQELEKLRQKQQDDLPVRPDPFRDSH